MISNVKKIETRMHGGSTIFGRLMRSTLRSNFGVIHNFKLYKSFEVISFDLLKKHGKWQAGRSIKRKEH